MTERLLHHLRLREGVLALQRSRMGRRAAGTGTVPEVWLSSLPMREGIAAVMSHLRETALRVPGGTLRGLRSAPLRVQKEDEGKSEACRRERARHPAHGMHHLLAHRWYSHIRPAIHGTIVWQTAGVL